MNKNLVVSLDDIKTFHEETNLYPPLFLAIL